MKKLLASAPALLLAAAAPAAIATTTAAAASSSPSIETSAGRIAPPGAFDIVWNGPSATCQNPALSLSNFSGIRVNRDQAFTGEEIVCFYSIGAFPSLTATQNATPCWSSHVPGCSWNPWDQITPTSNGGVPQVANLSLHLEQLTADVENLIPDAAFEGLAVVDWEAWRPLTAENDDGLSLYTEYSRRLVAADPAWAGKNASAVAAEAQRRFDAGAQAFFTATVSGIKKLRPHARVGFYSQGINHGASAGGTTRVALEWLWRIVDAVFPSVYPFTDDADADAAFVADAVLGAMMAADMAQNASAAAGEKPPRRPAVFPYARGLVAPPGNQPFTPGLLAAQVQVPAGLGADGVVLWGSSGDYHGNGCAMVEEELTTFAGDTMDKCVANRAACAVARCSGHGRCVDYNSATLNQTCLDEENGDVLRNNSPAVSCRCDPGFTGDDCNATTTTF